MDSGTIFLLALVGVLALACLFLFATARRRDVDRALDTLVEERGEASGSITPALVGSEPARARSGREVERSVALERHREAPPAASPPPPPPAIPDEETLGVTRRQVLNRGIVVSMLLA